MAEITCAEPPGRIYSPPAAAEVLIRSGGNRMRDTSGRYRVHDATNPPPMIQKAISAGLSIVKRFSRRELPPGPSYEDLTAVRIAAAALMDYLRDNVGETADWPVEIKAADDEIGTLCERLNAVNNALKGIRREPAGNAEVYDVYVGGVKLDPYRILDAYGITNQAQGHAIKKLLRAGRSHKTLVEDIKETVGTLRRWLDMIAEDASANLRKSGDSDN